MNECNDTQKEWRKWKYEPKYNNNKNESMFQLGVCKNVVN